MTDHHRLAGLAVTVAALSLVLSACSSAGEAATMESSPAAPSAAPSTDPAPSSQTATPAAVGTATATAMASEGAGSTPVLDQAWATAELVDVTTGETFRIADHAGKVIIIETMAIWCPTCRAQQGDVRSALGRLPADSVVYVVLDIDPSENATSLAQYRKSNSFPGQYAIAGAKVARALAGEFGDQVLNPPSTPIVVVGTDGQVTLTDFGRKSAGDIVDLAQANGA